VDETQIKIRSQRVELGEIEHHVRSVLPEAQTVAVDLIQQDSKTSVLAAFIASIRKSPEISIASIRDRLSMHLEEMLPTHMVPSVMIWIETVPLTSAGKVDGRELRQLGQESISTGNATYLDDSSAKRQEPATDLERQMPVVWADVLNLPVSNISVALPFFNLGGDSITAIQVVGLYPILRSRF